MGKLGNYINKLSKITEDTVETGVLEVVKQHEDVITNMNTDQLFSGEDDNGATLPNYSPVSVEVYSKPPGPIRLYDQGDFYRGIFIKTDKFPVLFDGRDSKTDMLRGEYGPILGLKKENIRELNKVYLKGKIKSYYKALIEP